MLTILIVDDDSGDRKQVRRALIESQLPCKCFEAESVKEALKLCVETTFDCAIMDYNMPGYNGLEGIRALHEEHPYISIIMATGQGDEFIATEAMKSGAADYIPKIHIHGISIKRMIENAIEKAELKRKIETQQHELSHFALILAHDLKQPICSIQAFSQFIEEAMRAPNFDKDKVANYCRYVTQGIKRMGELIDMLQEYTQIDTNVEFKPVDMNHITGGVISNLEHLKKERRAQISYDNLPQIIGNAPQLTQLLQNIIGNAVKYCTAEVPTVRITAKPDMNNSWLFIVEDNGIGIPEASYKQIFEPFKRLHGTGVYEGSGLGLATCKKIVERHHGKIWCESQVGKGTTFFFTLNGGV